MTKVILKIYCGCGKLAFCVGEQEGNEVVEYRDSPHAGECSECSARKGDYQLKPNVPPVEAPMTRMAEALLAEKHKPKKGGPPKNDVRASYKDADRDKRKKKAGEHNQGTDIDEEPTTRGRGIQRVDWEQTATQGGRRDRRLG